MGAPAIITIIVAQGLAGAAFLFPQTPFEFAGLFAQAVGLFARSAGRFAGFA
jgi:hypothetical protein